MELKIRINKATLGKLPAPVARHVAEWKQRYRKAHFRATQSPIRFNEDGHITVYNIDTGKSQRARVAGEFAGPSGLSPTDKVELPSSCIGIQEYFFCGLPIIVLHFPNGHGFTELEPLATKRLGY